MTALNVWRESLAAWAIPTEVEPVDSPWVLDIGAAAGAGSLPLRGATEIVAVDGDTELLAEFSQRASTLGIPARTVRGHWPDMASTCPVVDVVVCNHIVYNVADLAPFVAALTAHARRLVVLETAESHPLTSLNPLWRHFHGIERPSGPTADDTVNCLRELGIEPRVDRWHRAPAAEHPDFAALVEVTRRRLCLPATRLSEVEDQLRALGVDPAGPRLLRGRRCHPVVAALTDPLGRVSKSVRAIR